MAEVLAAPSAQSYLPDSSPLRRSASHSSFLLGPSIPSSDSESPSSYLSSSPERTQNNFSRSPSYHSTPPSSVSLDVQNIADDNDDDNFFPSYNDAVVPGALDSVDTPKPLVGHNGRSPSFAVTAQEEYVDDQDVEDDTEQDLDLNTFKPPVADDTAIRREPSKQVDYLSHNWREEDIWSSWKHIVSSRRIYGERSRLENASWRTWTKQKYQLQTVPPQNVNWSKDFDVTWLYGPFQEEKAPRLASEPASRLSKSSSFTGNKKPILKKRTVSEEMLQKSLSTSSLVKQAAAAVQAQRTTTSKLPQVRRPGLRRANTDFMTINIPPNPSQTEDTTKALPSTSSSSVGSPDANGRKHIRFDNKVEQCIAVEFQGVGEDEYAEPVWSRACSDSESDEDGMPMIKTKARKPPVTPKNSKQNSFNQDNKGIAMLPSTTIKFHHDDPTCQGHRPSQFFPSRRSGNLSPSPSLETIKPSDPSTNFLLDDEEGNDFLLEEDDGLDEQWNTSGAFRTLKRDSFNASRDSIDRSVFTSRTESDDSATTNGMRRTPSGMFMPLDGDEEDTFASAGLLGRVVDTVNTAKDIMTVFWNVGWRQ
ncbi:MAG: hypothetical protein M1831_002828 [Alyxoria varia]|nr:MAG: hypothetical protein M1831_002828 [Alyxoria varia]